MSCGMIKSLEELNSEIQVYLTELDYLNKQKETLEEQRAKSIQGIENEKGRLVVEQVDQENLSGRKEEVTRKFSVLNVVVRKDADKITEEMKSLTKALNVKTSIEQCKDAENDSFFEFKIEFPDIKHSYVTILYDSSTDDFECKL
jgi:hypothetical protein